MVRKVGKVVLSVLAGAVVWAALWNLGMWGAGEAFPEIIVATQPLAHTPILLAFIVYSAALSLLAGYVTASAGGGRPMLSVWILSLLQLSIGILVEISYWSLMPVWYHVVFLVLLVPVTVYGGIIRARRLQPS